MKRLPAASAALSAEDLDKMHHAAHAGCFVANSVKTEVKVEPRS
jgi:organic hydroperoxide reductase OsmC/OhrA